MSKIYITELPVPVQTSHIYGKQEITAIETWYDPSMRLWTSLLVDKVGYQVIPASYGVTKDESIEDAQAELKIYATSCRACGSPSHTFCNA